MASLVMIGSSNQLLQIFSDQINHLQICSTHEQAKLHLQNTIDLNKDIVSLAEIDDNIVKIQTHKISLLIAESQLAKVKTIKQFLLLVDSNAQNRKITHISEGFYYFNSSSRKIQFYQLPTSSNHQNARLPVLQLFSIFTHLLFYSTNLKDYINKWIQLAFKNNKFKPELQGKSKIENFLTDIFNKDITSVKMAIHSLEIIIEKMQPINQINNIQFSEAFNEKSSNKYQNIKINQQNKTTPRRLKQSNSMTNLSSCSKNRKYKKQSPLGNRDKLFKQLKENSSKGWQTKTNNFGETINSKMAVSLLKTSNQSSLQKCPRQDAFMQSFSKINKFDMERMAINQQNLYELLEKKQKIRKNNSVIGQYQFGSTGVDNQIRKSIPLVMNQSKISISESVNIKIQPHKKQLKLKINSCLYSINQAMINPRQQKVYNPQPTLRKSQKKVSQSKIHEKLEQNQLTQIKKQEVVKKQKIVEQTKNIITPFVRNSTFLLQTIQILCAEKGLRKYWLISLYTMYVYYYLCLFGEKANAKQEASHKANLTAICSRIEQMKASPELSKQLDSKSIGQVEYLISQYKNSEGVEKEKIREVSIRVLTKQFQRNKVEIVKGKNQLMKGNKFKTFLLYMVRLAVSISIVKDIKRENCGVDDFSRYQLLILDEKRPDLEIDLLAEIRNCEIFL